MRLFLPALGLATLFTSPLVAQGPVHIETIKWPEIEVRSGPSDQYPVTGVLRKNAQVWVRTKPSKDGFLEILPPEGSVSWIPKAVVTKLGNPSNGRQAFLVAGDEKTDGSVPILAGGPSMADGPLQRDLKISVQRGTQGYIRGNPVKPSWDDRQWYPIDPLPGESRFVLANAIQEPTPADIAKSKQAAEGQLTSRPARDINDLFRQAQRADQAGDFESAIKLYQEVGAASAVTNDSLANYCATRVYELRQKRTAYPGTPVSRGNAPRTTNSSPGGPEEPPLPGMNKPSTPSPAPNSNGLRSTGAGFLRRTGFTIDNRATYAVIDQARRVIFYVTPEPGINLEPYIERWVDLHGVVEVRGDIRGGAEYMRVSKVFLVR